MSIHTRARSAPHVADTRRVRLGRTIWQRRRHRSLYSARRVSVRPTVSSSRALVFLFYFFILYPSLPPPPKPMPPRHHSFRFYTARARSRLFAGFFIHRRPLHRPVTTSPLVYIMYATVSQSHTQRRLPRMSGMPVFTVPAFTTVTLSSFRRRIPSFLSCLYR